MAEHDGPLDAEARRQRRHFTMRRLHSLSGVVPVGVFLVVHLWTNAKALSGPVTFGHAVGEIHSLPFLVAIEVFGIFVPLAFHALYGVALVFQSRPNVGVYGYSRNWLFVLQRATGVLAFLFILMHLKDFRVAKALGAMRPEGFFDELGQLLGVRWKALVYLFGTTASIFHFANGVRTVLWSWGVTISDRSQRFATWACAGLGAALWLLGASTILFFSTGGQSLLPTSAVRAEGGRDPLDRATLPAASAATLTAPHPSAGAPSRAPH
jgi:succinate dehydrogenase / fumarate reductase cytochrome b subunit